MFKPFQINGTVTKKVTLDPFTGIESGSISYEKNGGTFFLPFNKSDSKESLYLGDNVSFQMAESLEICLEKRPRNRRVGHEMCRKSVCIFCGKKCKEKNRNVFSVPSLAENLRNFIDLESSKVQVGLCNTCRRKEKFKNNLEKTDLFQFDFDFVPPNLSSSCCCEICEIFHEPAFLKNPKTSTSETSEFICLKCKEITQNPKAHKCKPISRQQKFENIKGILESSPKFTQCLVAHYLKNYDPSPNSHTVKLPQFQNSNKLSVSVGPPPKTFPKPNVSVKQLIEVRKTFGPQTSDTNIKNLATWLNKVIGPGTVELNFQKKLRARYDYFKPDWQYGFLPFEESTKIGKNKYQTIMVRRPVALMKDVEQVRAKLCKLRGLQEAQVFCRLHIDSGGKTLKFSFSLVDVWEKEGENKGHKSTGVNTIFLFAIVHKGTETNFNIRQILKRTNFWGIKNRINSNDYKMHNIIAGIGSHASTFPLDCCEVHKNNLNSLGKIRTIRSLIENWQTYQITKDSIASKSVKNPPLFFNPDAFDTLSDEILDTPVIEHSPPSELHLELAFNSLFDHFLNACPLEIINKWIQAALVTKKPYHGGTFEGNQVKKILLAVPCLRQLAETSCSFITMEFVECFHQFNLVRTSCFGTHLDPDYASNIDNFQRSIESLEKSTGLKIIPKFHVIFFHVKAYCANHQRGLGLVAEQTGEALHSKCNKFFGNFNITGRDPMDPALPEIICNAATKFNALNIMEDESIDIFDFVYDDSDSESD